MAIGAPLDLSVHFLYGSPAGLQASGNGGPEDQIVHGGGSANTGFGMTLGFR